MSGILQPDPDTARKALELIVTRGAVFEIRALMKDERDRTWRESGYFNALDAAIRVLPAITRRATGIYLTLNPVIPDLWSRAANRMRRVDKGDTTGDQHIVRRTRILFDFDGTPVSGVSSTNAEHAKAQELACRVKAELSAEGWPDPLEGDSGNGAHLVYGIDLPAHDDQLVERVLKAAHQRWGGDGLKVDASNHNPARITKLFGTPVRKGDNTPERPHRLSTIVWAPSRLETVSLERLQHLAATLSTPKPNAPRRSRRSSNDHTPGDEYLRAFLSKHRIEAEDERRFELNGQPGTIWVLKQCPFNADHASGEVHVHALDSGPLGFRCKHNSCGAFGWTEFRRHFEPDAYSAPSLRMDHGQSGPSVDDTNANQPAAPDRSAAQTLVPQLWQQLERRHLRGERYLADRGLDPVTLRARGDVVRYRIADGAPSVLLHDLETGAPINILTRQLDQKPKVTSICTGRRNLRSTVGTLGGRIRDFDTTGKGPDIAILVEGVSDTLAAFLAFPGYVVLGASNWRHMAAIAAAVAPRVVQARGWLLIGVHDDEEGKRGAVRAMQAAIAAGLVLEESVDTIDIGAHHDLADAWSAGWQWPERLNLGPGGAS